jgi:hypothetical protein
LEAVVDSGLVVEIWHEFSNGALADECVAVLEQRNPEKGSSRATLPNGYDSVIESAAELFAEKLEPLGMANWVETTSLLVACDVGAFLIKCPAIY